MFPYELTLIVNEITLEISKYMKVDSSDLFSGIAVSSFICRLISSFESAKSKASFV